jgi:hypothetical protein
MPITMTPLSLLPRPQDGDLAVKRISANLDKDAKGCAVVRAMAACHHSGLVCVFPLEPGRQQSGGRSRRVVERPGPGIFTGQGKRDTPLLA